MSKKSELRQQREGTVINVTSKKQEQKCIIALKKVEALLKEKHKVKLEHNDSLYLSKVITHLKKYYPNVDFANVLKTSYMKPDGGILYLIDNDSNHYPILITEVKNQGTNDARLAEGKTRQAKGNAIERLGKNVIGFRTFLLNESIFPFVCFGYGCDFEKGSSILDRVITINMFGKLNITNLSNEGDQGRFNRGSFYFRETDWSEKEMCNIMFDIASRSIYYYFSKYGEKNFL